LINIQINKYLYKKAIVVLLLRVGKNSLQGLVWNLEKLSGMLGNFINAVVWLRIGARLLDLMANHG